jgi:hypothetical protein
MRCPAVHWLFLALTPTMAGALQAQAPASPTCSDSLGKSMAFLQGDWEGRSYSIAGRDTILDALMKVHSQPLFGRCALEERWEAVKDDRVLFTAKVLRAYDAPTQRWSVYYVDDQLNSQLYEGRRHGTEWRFFRTRRDQGKPIQVRLTWRPIQRGYEQLIERSRDGGATWTLGAFVTYHSVPAADNR